MADCGPGTNIGAGDDRDRSTVAGTSGRTISSVFAAFSRFSIFCAVFSGLLLRFGAAEIEPSARTENQDDYNHANYPLRQPQIPVGS